MGPVPGTERFATALTCIDERIHAQLQAGIRQHLLADRVRVSHQAHAGTTLAIASHSGCAAHPVSDPVHHRDLRRPAERLRPLCAGMDLRTVHVGNSDGVWTVVETGTDTPDGDRRDVQREAAR